MVKRTREERRRFLTKAHAAIAAGLLTPAHESDDDEDVPSPAEVRVRERRGFVRERPRFRERQGHARWYGEWGTGFWHQFLDRENVETIRCCGKSSNRDFEFLTLCFVSWRTR